MSSKVKVEWAAASERKLEEALARRPNEVLKALGLEEAGQLLALRQVGDADLVILAFPPTASQNGGRNKLRPTLAVALELKTGGKCSHAVAQLAHNIHRVRTMLDLNFPALDHGKVRLVPVVCGGWGDTTEHTVAWEMFRILGFEYPQILHHRGEMADLKLERHEVPQSEADASVDGPTSLAWDDIEAQIEEGDGHETFYYIWEEAFWHQAPKKPKKDDGLVVAIEIKRDKPDWHIGIVGWKALRNVVLHMDWDDIRKSGGNGEDAAARSFWRARDVLRAQPAVGEKLSMRWSIYARVPQDHGPALVRDLDNALSGGSR